jgi:hypothetical protein
MLCLAGLQKRELCSRMLVKKLQPSPFIWAVQFVAQYVGERTCGADCLFEPEEFARLFDRQANQNPLPFGSNS